MSKQRISSTHFRNALELLQVVNKTTFKNIFMVLSILVFLPISIATYEQSYSCLWKTKSNLQSTTSWERLNGRASMNIHKNHSVDKVLEFLKKSR